MAATTADLNPKTLEGAKRQFVELYGSALVTNTYLRIALALVSLVAVGLIGLNVYTVSRYSQVKPLVIRIDDVGRAEAVQYDATSYQPQPPELRYFLTQFIVKHFSRLRATVQRDAVIPGLPVLRLQPDLSLHGQPGRLSGHPTPTAERRPRPGDGGDATLSRPGAPDAGDGAAAAYGASPAARASRVPFRHTWP